MRSVLQERRIAAGLSQTELAELAEVPVRTLQTWERVGAGHATVENAAKVADALGLWIDQLVTYEHDVEEDE